MFNKRKKVSKRKDTNKRTRVIKVGGMTFHKKVRKANAKEKLENKEHRLQYKRNKAKIKRRGKIKRIEIEA